MKYYVLGFLFTEDGKKVVLIHKNRPDWQAGYLNGVGGHIENSDDNSELAMVREFYEETGVLIENWTPLAAMQGKDWSVDCYKAFSDKAYDIKTITDEEVILVDVDKINRLNIINGLSYLIPMALQNEKIEIRIKYVDLL